MSTGNDDDDDKDSWRISYDGTRGLSGKVGPVGSSMLDQRESTDRVLRTP